jgi:hypothetical protein
MLSVVAPIILIKIEIIAMSASLLWNFRAAHFMQNVKNLKSSKL